MNARLSSDLKDFYGSANVISHESIHHIYPCNNLLGKPRFHLTMTEIKSTLDGFSEVYHYELKNCDSGGAMVYENGKPIGTLVIHSF